MSALMADGNVQFPLFSLAGACMGKGHFSSEAFLLSANQSGASELKGLPHLYPLKVHEDTGYPPAGM